LIFIAMAAARIENASKMQQINPVAIDAVSLSLSVSQFLLNNRYFE
jgi:hypothetical protein